MPQELVFVKRIFLCAQLLLTSGPDELPKVLLKVKGIGLYECVVYCRLST